ncbi:MAG: hypothetical protein R6U11_04635 [Bacteroidales bacterium]
MQKQGRKYIRSRSRSWFYRQFNDNKMTISDIAEKYKVHCDWLQTVMTEKRIRVDYDFGYQETCLVKNGKEYRIVYNLTMGIGAVFQGDWYKGMIEVGSESKQALRGKIN